METKSRFAALWIALAIVPAPWHEAYAQPAPAAIPFADGISIPGYSPAAGATILARLAGGAYTPLQFNVTQPYAFTGSAGNLNQLLAGGGWKSLLAGSAGPAGVGRQSQALAFTDLDNTGSLGAAFASGNSVGLYRLSSTAPYHWTAANYQIGPDANSVFFADFNGDGKADLAVAYDGSTTIPGGIAILLNKGDGTFGSPITYAGGTQATRFAVFDLNHDGALDIATASLDQKVTVILGKGDGTFGSPAVYAAGSGQTGGSGQAIAIADVNDDGLPDIVAGGTTGILLNNGGGTFRAGSPLPVAASTTFIWAFAAGDLDGDGKIDLAYVDIENQIVAPLFGNGDGTFRTGPTYAVSQLPDTVVLADYNNDGRLDIIHGLGDARILGPSINSGNVDILLNSGNQTFAGAPTYFGQQYPGGFEQQAGVAAGNFGGGLPGVLSTGSSGLVFLPAVGNGGLGSPQTISAQPFLAIAAGDFNGDGKADAAVADGNGNIEIFLGTASGFSAPTIIAGGFYPTGIVSADFDGDGKADLAFVSETDRSGGGTSPGTLAFLKGNGNGTFGAPVTIAAGLSPFFLSATDLNNDGKPDLVFSDSGTNGFGGAVYVSLNMGKGVFQNPAAVFSGSYPAFGIGDVDGDGRPDLVASDGQTVSWLAGKGDGTFLAPTVITVSDANNTAILVEDFNGDGKPDLILAHRDTDSTFLAGYGGGSFSAETHFLSTAQPSFLLTADMNGDGRPDLIVAGFTISVLLSQAVLPAPAAVSPSSGSGASQTMTFTFTDPSGWQSLGVVNVLINNFIDGRSACYLAYSVPSSTLYLVNDGGNAAGPYAGSVALGSAATIQNSQCGVTLVSAVGSGTSLTLTLSFTFAQSFGGSRILYTAAGDTGQNNSGWVPLGVWQVPGAAASVTTAVLGMTPASGAGPGPTAYTFNFSDSQGFQNLGVENILVNSALDGRHACYLAYARPLNVLYLVNDNGDALLPSQSLAASGSLSNSQCMVSWGANAVAAGGNNLSLSLNIGFSSGFGPKLVFYLAARDVNEGNNTGWQAYGTWAVE